MDYPLICKFLNNSQPGHYALVRSQLLLQLCSARSLWLKDLDSITRKSKVFELEKKRLEYWRLQSELSATVDPKLAEELKLSSARVGRLADEKENELARVLRHVLVAGGLIFGMAAPLEKLAVTCPNIAGESKVALSVAAGAIAAVGVSYAVSTLKEIAETLFGSSTVDTNQPTGSSKRVTV